MTPAQEAAGLVAAYALKATGPSFAADPARYVREILKAGLAASEPQRPGFAFDPEWERGQ